MSGLEIILVACGVVGAVILVRFLYQLVRVFRR
jgi:hypothetical protein